MHTIIGWWLNARVFSGKREQSSDIYLVKFWNKKKKKMSLFNMFQPTLDTKLSYTYHKNLRGKSVMVLLPMSEQHQSLADWKPLISVCKNKKVPASIH